MDYYGIRTFQPNSHWTSQHSWIYHVCEFNYMNEVLLNIAHAELKPW